MRTKPDVGKKRDVSTVPSTNVYFAVKSQNEIYFQLASIFKLTTRNDDNLKQKMFNEFLYSDPSEILLEN